MKPNDRAESVLFKGRYPQGSIFAAVAELKNATPEAAAALILSKEIPFETAIGAVSKLKGNKEILFAIIERMTGNQGNYEH